MAALLELQGVHTHIGAYHILHGVDLAVLGVDAFEPGDVVLHNDPYRGGAHLPEHSVVRPVFYEGELMR